MQRVIFDNLETQPLDKKHRGPVVVVEHGTLSHVFVADLGPVRQVVPFGRPNAAKIFLKCVVFGECDLYHLFDFFDYSISLGISFPV